MTDFYVDENYIPTLGMKIEKGRNFSKDIPTNSTGLILNETAVKVLGFKDPFNETLYRPDFRPGENMKPVRHHVLAVIKDFNYSSMHQHVGPLYHSIG